MSLSTLIQFAERLFSSDTSSAQNARTPRSSQSEQIANKLQSQQRETDRGSFGGDRFTPSQGSDSSAASDIITPLQFGQLRFSAVNIDSGIAATGGTLPAAPAASVPQPVQAIVPASTPAATSTTAITPTVASAVTVPSTSRTTASDSADALLQSLNLQLAALGLSPSEIQAFDQVAKLIQQFSPPAYQDLANQLNALAAQFTSRANSAAIPSGGHFQLTELSLQFKGVNETVQSSGQNGGANSSTQISGYQLQLQEVRVGLANPSGQTAQLQTPQKATAAAAASA